MDMGGALDSPVFHRRQEMATNTREITPDEWQIITSSACSFQVLGDRAVYVTEASSKPTIDTDDFKIALPKEIYTFDPQDGSLYALAIDVNNVIGFDII
jgi:hypothetical protein